MILSLAVAKTSLGPGGLAGQQTCRVSGLAHFCHENFSFTPQVVREGGRQGGREGGEGPQDWASTELVPSHRALYLALRSQGRPTYDIEDTFLSLVF